MSDALADGADLGRPDRPSSAGLTRALRVALPLMVVAAGVTVVVLLRATAPAPEREAGAALAPTVEVVPVRRADGALTVEAHGTVVAAREARLAPEIGGRVSWMAEALTEGGRFEAGEPMLRLDETDLRLALAARRSDIADAELALAQQESAQVVARRSWHLFSREDPVPSTERGRALALAEPQVEAARARLAAARDALALAEVDLARATLKAPFAGIVAEESVDLGQPVTPSQPVLSLVGTDEYHVHTRVPIEALPSIRVPSEPGEPGSAAEVSEVIRGELRTWHGHVARLLPAVDAGGSQARLVVAVPEPLGSEPGVPLLLGAFVRVRLEAMPLDALVVPRAALRGDDTVWVVGDDARLDIRVVSIIWRREEDVLVRGGLQEGERVVISPLPAPVDGMRVTVVDGGR